MYISISTARPYIPIDRNLRFYLKSLENKRSLSLSLSGVGFVGIFWM